MLAPPSIHPSGNPYKWDENANSVPPPYEGPVEEKQKTKQEVGPPKHYVKGERVTEIFRQLGRARTGGASEQTLIDLARSIYANQCDKDPEISDEELVRMAGNAVKYPDSPPPILVARSFADICTSPSPPPKTVVENLLLQNQINMICGPAMTGKSMLALDMAVSISSGGCVLGHEEFLVPEFRKVVYVYGEQGTDLWETRARAIASVKRVKPDMYLVAGHSIQLNKRSHLEELKHLMAKLGSDVVFLDPLVVMFGIESENDASEVVRAVREPLQNLVDSGITPIVVHHAAKQASATEPSSARELVRGSGDLIAMLGSVVGLWGAKNGAIKGMVTGRLNFSTPFQLKFGSPVSGIPGDELDIEDAAWELPVHLLEYVGGWVSGGSTSGNWMEQVPQGEFTSKEVDAAWGGLNPKTLTRRLKALQESEQIFVTREEEVSRGLPKRKYYSRSN